MSLLLEQLSQVLDVNVDENLLILPDAFLLIEKERYKYM